MLNFLNCTLQVLPLTISCNIAQKLFRLTSIESHEFWKGIYFTLETLFASTVLPTEFLENFIKDLLSSPPEVEFEGESISNEVEVMIVGYCLALS